MCFAFNQFYVLITIFYFALKKERKERKRVHLYTNVNLTWNLLLDQRAYKKLNEIKLSKLSETVGRYGTHRYVV